MYAQIAPLFLNTVFLQIIRGFFLVGFALYFIFALVTVRQIDVMSKTVDTPLSPAIRVVGYVHLFASLIAIVFVLFYLH